MKNLRITRLVLQKKFPKAETFCLAKEIKEVVYQGLKQIIYAIKINIKRDKIKYLFELDILLGVLKVYIRQSYKYKYISQQNYTTWSALTTELGNMLGGWIISCQKR